MGIAFLLAPGPKTTSTSFGMKAGPPALPCRGDVVVENRAAAPKSCLLSLEMRSPTAAGGLLPTGEASTATKTTFNKSPLRLYATEETNSKETNLWTSTPPIRYDDSTFWRIKLLAASSYRRVIETKPGKIGRSIQALFKIVSAPTRFWERGASYFVVRLCVLERLDEAAAFFGGE